MDCFHTELNLSHAGTKRKGIALNQSSNTPSRIMAGYWLGNDGRTVAAGCGGKN
jgi:hypothetical protein